MSENQRQLLSIGVFLIIIVAVILLFAASIIGLLLVFPLILVLAGVWTLVLAGMRYSSPQKYEQSGFGTLMMGLLLIAVGGAWYLLYFNWLFSIALVLLVLGIIAIVSAMRRK